MNNKSIGRKVVPYAYMAPALISICIFTALPIIYTIIIAFTNKNLDHMSDYVFVGLKNIEDIITGSLRPVFLPVFSWNVIFALVTSVAAFFIGLILAIVLNNPNMRESKYYRAILIIPWALPAAIATLSWQGMLNDSYGAINQLLALFHIPNIPWFNDYHWTRVGVVLASVWLGYPFNMNVCLGALQSINPAYYEAAEIDGVTKWQRFKWITFPLITSAAIPILVSSFAFNFNNFGAAYLITGGGPPRMDTQYAGYTDILTSAGYKMTVDLFRYDLACALSIIVFLIIGTLTLVNMKMTHAFEEVD